MPTLAYYNPFQQQELRIPDEFHDDVAKYTQTFTGGAGKPDPENHPFDRYVDLWMAAVCLGALQALEDGTVPKPDVKKWHRFNFGSLFQGDTTRIELLELLAISLSDDAFIVQNPKKVIDLANDLAAVGLPKVIEMLQQGQGKALWNVTHHLLQLIKGGEHPEPMAEAV